MVSIKKKSGRVPTKRRAKIEKKVKEHNRKQKKLSKKKPTFQKLKRKDPGVPSSLPFKEEVLKGAEEWKRKREEERELQKERRKKERQSLLDKKRNLDSVVKDAQKKTAEYEKKKALKGEVKGVGGKNVENSLKTYYKEFRKVVDAADVVLEVLDARDPLGSRCSQMEEAIISSGTDKRLVLVLNKIDLVPRENVEAWLKHLKNQFPVVAFKASTQTQNDNLCQTKMPLNRVSQDLLKSSHCLGADTLMKLLGNYCRNKGVKTVIRVGVVGFPNTGKSSIINSLKRTKTCNVGSTPGITKQMQEVQLDKHIKLLDSPGVVMATGNTDTSVILRNCVRLETLTDPVEPVEAILKRCNKQQIILHFGIPDFKDTHEFLSLLARRQGRLRKGGIPDVRQAAKSVLQSWNGGKITYYTHPPEQSSLATHVSAEFVTQMGKEFDIDSLLEEQQKVIQGLALTSSKHMLVESLGPAKTILSEGELKLGTMDTKVGDKEEVEMADEEEEEEGAEVEEESMEEDDEDSENTTVSVSTSGNRSRKSSVTASKEKKPGVASKPQTAGLPQLNKARKKDFKKMKKDRRRRDKVAGQLSDALSAAFNTVSADAEDYSFDQHF